jgi:hypothetical protein
MELEKAAGELGNTLDLVGVQVRWDKIGTEPAEMRFIWLRIGTSVRLL